MQIKKYNEAKRLNNKLLNMMSNCETKSKSKQMHNLNKKLLKETIELRS